jgi:hypothetical protein
MYQYQIIEEIGIGGSGKVFSAFYQAQNVCLKKITTSTQKSFQENDQEIKV